MLVNYYKAIINDLKEQKRGLDKPERHRGETREEFERRRSLRIQRHKSRHASPSRKNDREQRRSR